MIQKLMKRGVAVMIFLALGLAAVSGEPDGSAVMNNVYNRPSGDEMSADLTMLITNSRGSTRERSIAQFRKEADGVEKKILFFTAPADVRDTSFLSWSYQDGRNDDQWIYLPALKRVKRISADSKSDSFMGSDFTYDDMGERHPSEDTHRILREENVKGQPCYVIESIPVTSGDSYDRTLSWIVKDEWIGLKKEFYKDSILIKTLTIDSYDTIDGFWVITDMTMRNLEKKSSTQIRMENVGFNEDRKDSFFSERQMRVGPR